MRHATSVVRLDRPRESQVFRDDPDVALVGLSEPVLIDEWQLVPEVLGAIKRSVDTDPRPGRFIVTGSVRGDVNSQLWPGTGRLVRVPVYGVTVREQLGRIGQPSLFDRLGNDEIPDTIQESYDLSDYVSVALKSGFPEAVTLGSDSTREGWLQSYVDQLLTRDVVELDQQRDPELLRRFFAAYALNTAGVPNDKTLYDAAHINAKTAQSYERLLSNLLVTENIPAWSTNRLQRLTMNPKRYLVDVGLLVGALFVDTSTVLRDGDLLGRVLDTFVTSQLRADITTSQSRPRLFHLRQQQGRHEIDLIAETRGRKVIAFEIKSSAAPNRNDARHLEWLREKLDDSFHMGVVFHTGPRAYSLGERIHALPISSIWAI